MNNNLRFYGQRVQRRVEMNSLRRYPIAFNLFLALVVLTAWLLVGGAFSLSSLANHWQISSVMVFGSLVGGGTSEGGGAVIFPVFTKALHIPPHDAMVFAFACQSVGMGSASFSILWNRIPIEVRVLPWGGGFGILGMVLSSFFYCLGALRRWSRWSLPPFCAFSEFH